MKILNLTQHNATPAQLADGVVDFQGSEKQMLTSMLTFTSIPSKIEIQKRAKELVSFATYYANMVLEIDSVMIGGAPFLMAPLENALKLEGIGGIKLKILYAYSDRVSVETVLDNGTIKKTMVFKHLGFVEA